jgi:hypothetical protein
MRPGDDLDDEWVDQTTDLILHGIAPPTITPDGQKVADSAT